MSQFFQPTPDRPFRLGTRQSPLAMAQAREARTRLCTAHGWPDAAVELVPVSASGDRIQDRPLAEIGGKALWTKELDAWLIEGRIDAAVHSMKDVETVRPTEIALGAVLPRADKADRLLGAASIAQLRPGAVVGTSAPRRAAQLLYQRPDCSVVMFRGNVATRMAKLAAGEVDATFLAAAGLDRLGEQAVGSRLDPKDWLPAAGQAAIGLECRADDDAAFATLAAIDDVGSRKEVEQERALLAALGGNCHSPVGVLCSWQDGAFSLAAALYSDDGSHHVAGSLDYADGEAGGEQLAENLLARATRTIRTLFTGES